jgi:hypothetical protein
MIVSHHQNVGKNHNLLIANKSFKNVGKFKCLGTRVTNENCIHEEIKSILNLGNAYYHFIQSLFSCLVSKSLKIKINKTIILHVGLYGYETCSHTLKEEHRLRVFENRMMRKFGPKREEMVEGWKRLHNVYVCMLYVSPNIIQMIKSRRMRLEEHAAHMWE